VGSSSDLADRETGSYHVVVKLPPIPDPLASYAELRKNVIWQTRGPCNAHYMTLFSYILKFFYTSSIVS
jgi:hypothetical protein